MERQYQFVRIGSRAKLLRIGLIIAATATALIGALSAIERDPIKLARQPAAWVAKHSSSLPSSLAELASYPLRYRVAIFRALPKERRLPMLHQHLREVLATRSGEFSVEQRSYLESGSVPNLVEIARVA
jgi:hypothetical protein